MGTRSKAQRTVYNKILECNTKGFIDMLDFQFDDYEYGVVTQRMAFRPDLVALKYLGDCDLAWVITLANGFTNGIRDYTLGRKIKIPKI